VRDLVTAMCMALREPHRQGWVHRDLKPDNLLRFADRWVVADWGLGRRPRGQTTHPRRTQVGVQFGTEGFAAPELAVDAHTAEPAADVYSIGQIIGWALTGAWPQQNVPLLPSSGPWRTIVRAATLHDPDRRVATVHALLAMVTAEFDAPTELAARGGQLLPAVRAGDRTALVELFRLAAQTDLDHDFFRDVLVALDPHHLRAAVEADPHSVGEVVRAIRSLYASGAAGPEATDHGRAITWLLTIADRAESLAQADLLDDASHAILHLAASERVSPDVHGRIAAWLSSRTGDAASVVAAVLRRSAPGPLLASLADADPLDHRIRLALRPQPPAEAVGPARPPAEAGGPTGGAGPAAARREPAGLRRPTVRRRTLLLSSAIGVAIAVLIPLSTFLDDESPGGPFDPATTQSDDTIAGLPSVPSDLGIEMQTFIGAWDRYPSWSRCRSGSGNTALTGSFPAHKSQAGLPRHSSYCTNDGNFTLMFADFQRDAFAKVSRAYFDAAPPAHPVGGEKTPPSGLHVFAWSPTQRALVWRDADSLSLAVAVTNSPGTDLVELWSKYPPQ
jgi:protein kinase-like protein